MFIKVGKLMYVFNLDFMLNTATKYEHLTQHLCFSFDIFTYPESGFCLFSPARVRGLKYCHKVARR
jgi:hypothetical protein